jgi:hypothetical protein
LVLKHFESIGGKNGYVRLIKDNFFDLIRGFPWADTMLSAYIRVFLVAARIGHPVDWLASGVITLFFTTCVAVAAAWVFKSKDQRHKVFFFALLLYIISIITLPFPAMDYSRYLYVTAPFFLIWFWHGMNSINLKHKAQISFTFATVVSLAFVTQATLNGKWSSEIIPKGITVKPEERSDIEETALYIKRNVLESEYIAASFYVPVAQFSQASRRQFLCDYLDTDHFWTPITLREQGWRRADYILTVGTAPRALGQIGLLERVFLSSHNYYAILKVDRDGEKEWRRLHSIPPTTN